MTARTRNRGGKAVNSTLGNYVDNRYGSPPVYTDVIHTCTPLLERMSDEIHPRHPYEGGPMNLERMAISFKDASGWHGDKLVRPTYRMDLYYTGAYRCAFNPASAVQPSVDSTAVNYGPIGWNRYKPAKPDVSLAIFFAELTSVKDMVFKRLNSFRSLGSNYLAVEFGWKPFLSDIRSWYASLMKLDTQVAQLMRDNGRWIKRGGTVIPESIGSSISQPSGYGQIYPYDLNSTNHRCTETVKTTTKVWFSARFKYYIPSLNSKRWGRMRAIQELWDLKLTPEQVYKLIPFSWLVDWFTNLGSVISNLQSSIDDHLVAKYAYVMRSVETVTERTASAEHYQRVQPYPGAAYVISRPTVVCSSKVTTVTKSRAVANPFGFGLTDADLSLWQLSILGALGLTRRPVN